MEWRVKFQFKKLQQLGIGGHFEVPNSCKSILQMMVVDIEDGKASSTFKIKKYCNNPKLFVSEACID